MTEEEFLALYDMEAATPEPEASPSFSSSALSRFVDRLPLTQGMQIRYNPSSYSELFRKAFQPTEEETLTNRGVVRRWAQGVPWIGSSADEAEASLRGALDSIFTDQTYDEARDSRLNEIRGYLDAADENAPVASTVAEMTSGALFPGYAAKGLLAKLGLIGTEGAVAGFGKGEGGVEDRLGQAFTTGALATTLGGGLQLGGRGARALANFIDTRVEPSQLRSIGINMPNLSKSARKNADLIKGGYEDDIPLRRVAQKFREEKLVEPGQDAFERIAIINDKKEDVFGAIEAVTRQADEVADVAPVRIDLETDFANTYKLLDDVNEGTAEYKALKNVIDEQTNAIGVKILDEGTLKEVTRQKRLLYGKAYDVESATTRGKDLEKALGRDLRLLAERRVDELVSKGLISPDSKKIYDAANKAYGELDTLQRAYVDNVAKDLPQDARKELIDTIRTSGGFGSILNIAASRGNVTTKDVIPMIIGATTGSEQGQATIARGLSALRAPTEGAALAAELAGTAIRPATAAAIIREGAANRTRERDEESTTPVMSEDEFLSYFDAALGDGAGGDVRRGSERATEKKTIERGSEVMPVDNSLIKAVISVESAGKPNAVSSAGAQGLMQVMPATAKEVLQELGRDPAEYDPFDAQQNIEVGSFYLDKMLNMFGGDLELALAAYNGGPGRVSRLLKQEGASSFSEIAAKLPRETREYVPKVLSRIERA